MAHGRVRASLETTVYQVLRQINLPWEHLDYQALPYFMLMTLPKDVADDSSMTPAIRIWAGSCPRYDNEAGVSRSCANAPAHPLVLEARFCWMLFMIGIGEELPSGTFEGTCKDPVRWGIQNRVANPLDMVQELALVANSIVLRVQDLLD